MMLKEVIAAVFKSKGKRKMNQGELIYTMSFDLNWFTHEESKRIVEVAKETGVVEGDDELIPAFDIDSVEIKPDFKPDARKILTSSPMDELISEIASKTGKSYQEIVSVINLEQEKVSNLLSFEVVALIVAKRFGVEVGNYIDRIENLIFGAYGSESSKGEK